MKTYSADVNTSHVWNKNRILTASKQQTKSNSTMEKQFVYRVQAYYDMNIGSDEEIIQEIYATEELAQKRVRHLINTYKECSHAIEDCEPYGGEWDEDEYRLYAYMDSEWNVEISYVKEEVKTKI